MLWRESEALWYVVKRLQFCGVDAEGVREKSIDMMVSEAFLMMNTELVKDT